MPRPWRQKSMSERFCPFLLAAAEVKNNNASMMKILPFMAI
jgi:hypothetical protein